MYSVTPQLGLRSSSDRAVRHASLPAIYDHFARRVLAGRRAGPRTAPIAAV